MKASIIVPTKDRWNKLQRCLKAIKKNTFVSHEVIIIFDGDMRNYKRMLKKKQKNYKLVCNTKSREYFSCINQGCFLSSGDYIIYLADDIRPRKRWLKHSIEIFEKNFKDGIGIVALKTNMKEGLTHAPHGLVSRKLIATNGYLFPPVYKHYFGDTELSLRMQKLNKYMVTKRIVLNHDHKNVDKKFDDKVYSESFRKCWKSDEIQFHLRNPELVAGMLLVKGNRKKPFVYGQWWFQ